MPVRRLNFTQRRRIRKDDIVITLRSGRNGTLGFDADLRLQSYEFDPDARVFVEAYRQTSLMRFDFGTVSVPAPPADRMLGDFESEQEVLFRVRVTAIKGRPGLLLGEVDQVRPMAPGDQPDRRLPLLPPVPGDIGQQVWRVEFEGSPILRVSSGLDDWQQTVRSDSFRALVYPAAFRQILEYILFQEEYTQIDDFESWQSRWLLFATRIPGSGQVPRSSDDFRDWVEDAVGAFARQFGMRKRFTDEQKGAR